MRGQAVLGSDEFVDWVYDRLLSNKRLDKREFPGLKELQTGPSTIEEVAREVSLEFDVPPEELYRRRPGCRAARSVFIELCRVYLTRKMSHTEIGRRLGGLSVSALSQNRKRLDAKMRDDHGLRQSLYKLTGSKISK